jgi:hypothetical protein
MRRASIVLVLLSLFAAISLTAWAGDNEAEKIVDKAIKAHFPQGLDKKNTGLISKAKGTLHVMGLDLEFTQDVSVQMPAKFKEQMQMSVMNMNVTVTTVFNGKEGWIKANDKDIPVSDDILNEFKEAAYSMSLTQGMFLKEKGLKLTAVGESQVKGKPALGVRVSKDGKKDITLYFDKGTGLLAKVEMRKRDLMSGQEVTEERYIMEYQDKAGRKVAKKIEVHRDGKELMEAEVVDIQVVERLADTEFAKP